MTELTLAAKLKMAMRVVYGDGYRRAGELMQEAATELERHRWRSVDEKPEPGVSIQIHPPARVSDVTRHAAIFDGAEFFVYDTHCDGIGAVAVKPTHWREMTKP